MATAAAAASFAAPASAARIAVNPIRIELASTTNYCALHVSNQGDQPVAVQVRGFAWSQDPDGTDRLEPADIRLNPSILELPPGQTKLVRCSLPPHAGPMESSYRLLVDELPTAKPPPGTMQTLLRLSLPIFRKPPGAAPQLRWKIDPAGGLELFNAGRQHSIVGKLRISRPGIAPEVIERGFYLLAGARRTIALSASPAGITKVEAVNGAGQMDTVARSTD